MDKEREEAWNKAEAAFKAEPTYLLGAKPNPRRFFEAGFQAAKELYELNIWSEFTRLELRVKELESNQPDESRNCPICHKDLSSNHTINRAYYGECDGHAFSATYRQLGIISNQVVDERDSFKAENARLHAQLNNFPMITDGGNSQEPK